MFAYNGGNNQAGEIMGRGAALAAGITAAGNSNMADNLGMAAMALAQGYANREAETAKGKAYKNFLKTMGPELGFSPETIAQVTGMEDREVAKVSVPMNTMMNMGIYQQYRNSKLMPASGSGGAGGGGGGQVAGDEFLDL